MAVNFQEIIGKYAYDINTTDVDVTSLTKDALLFEDVDFEHYETLADRVKLKEFDLIDLSFLEMTNKEEFPVFAVFTTTSKTCFVKGSLETFDDRCIIQYITNFSSNIIRQRYLKHFKNFACKAVDKIPHIKQFMELEVHLSSKFSGILPLSAREDIAKNIKRFDEIVVVAEADNWQLEEKVVRSHPNPDPLIIGIRKNYRRTN